MGSPPQRLDGFKDGGFPFVLLSVKVSEDSEGISQSAWRFPRIRKAFRGARGDFRGFGKDFAERMEVSESSGRHFAERAAVSEGSESISRSAQEFPRAREGISRSAQPFPRVRKAFFPL